MQAEDDRPKLTSSREENNQRNLKDVNSGLGFAAGESPCNGNEPYQIFNSNSSRGDSSGQESPNKGQGTTGKMLRQLRDLQDTHLAYIDSNTQLLEAQLVANTQHRDKIIENMKRLEKNMLELLSEQELE